ncbi:MAG: hypothetical protein Q8P56_03175 [Candidatus Uhrbacteria bacterium]|nr:hypothetical protein [Candidatus Uhrbacteria bacterium]
MTKLQEVTHELARLSDELAGLPGQHEGELWGDLCAKAQELQRLIGEGPPKAGTPEWYGFEQKNPTATQRATNNVQERIPGTGLEAWETH